MINVLHCIGIPVKGGLERIVINLIQDDKSTINQISYYILSVGGNANEIGAFYNNIKIDFFLRFKNLFRIFSFLKERDFSIIHCHTLKSYCIFLILRFFFKYKLIFHFHSYAVFDYRYFSFATLLLKKADYRICVNDDLKNILNSKYGILCEVVYNGIDDRAIERLSQTIKPFQEDFIKLGYVGRLEVEKYVLDLAQIFNSIYQETKADSIVVFGSGSLKNKLITELNSKKILFEIIENEDKVEKIYSTFDLLLVPSKKETFSLVSLEALLAHRIVITRDIISYHIFKDLFPEQIYFLNDYLEAPKDFSKLSSGIISYNVDRVMKYFSVTAQKEKIEDIYISLLM
jgi:glycosyltransferase involved in cell wall biosynthesis